MSRLFLSHSSSDNAEAVALRDWLVGEGFNDLFLDLDPLRGIVAGERWERALNEAANRCQAVVFLISRAWLASRWCYKEMMLAQRLNKRMFGAMIEDVKIADIPPELVGSWQIVKLFRGADHRMFRASLPDGAEKHVTFSASELTKLKVGLTKAGLDPHFFPWPPQSDPNRMPWRGMLPLEAGDAGIFFGRDAQLVDAMDRLRGMAAGVPPRFLAILGASGSGKSSFLRAGLLPRLARDDRHFLPLPVTRPERAILSGTGEGFVTALVQACTKANLPISRAEVTSAVADGTEGLRQLLRRLAAGTQPPAFGNEALPPRAIVLPLDQTEEVFNAAGREEATRFLHLLHGLLLEDDPRLICLATIRSDAYEQLQSADGLEGIRQQTFSLPPLPRGQWANVIEGPAARAAAGGQQLQLDPALTAALLAEMETGSGRDALPLLAFTLGRLHREHGGKGKLTLADFHTMGGIAGSVNAAVERALARADGDPDLPRDREARLALLRRGLIPWLAGIDPDTGAARRLSAQLSDIPAEARPLIEHLVSERLLSKERAWTTDAAGAPLPEGEPVIEPVHEALLRQWGTLRGWLEEDFAQLTSLEALRRATRDWTTNARDPAWLNHRAGRLEDAERLVDWPDLWARIDDADRAYLAECRKAENEARDRELAETRKLAEAERARADAESGKRRWAMIGGGIAVAFAVLAILAGIYALKEAEEAERQAALRAAGPAQELLSQGQHLNALLFLREAILTLQDTGTVEGDMHVALRAVLRDTAGLRRMAIRNGLVPFDMGGRLILHDPGTGALNRITVEGVEPTGTSLSGQIVAWDVVPALGSGVVALQTGGKLMFRPFDLPGAEPGPILAELELAADDAPHHRIAFGPDGLVLVNTYAGREDSFYEGTHLNDPRGTWLVDLATGTTIALEGDHDLLMNDRSGDSYLTDASRGILLVWDPVRRVMIETELSDKEAWAKNAFYTCLRHSLDDPDIELMIARMGESPEDDLANTSFTLIRPECRIVGPWLATLTGRTSGSGFWKDVAIYDRDRLIDRDGSWRADGLFDSEYGAARSSYSTLQAASLPGLSATDEFDPIFAAHDGRKMIGPFGELTNDTRIEAATLVDDKMAAYVEAPVTGGMRELILIDLEARAQDPFRTFVRLTPTPPEDYVTPPLVSLPPGAAAELERLNLTEPEVTPIQGQQAFILSTWDEEVWRLYADTTGEWQSETLFIADRPVSVLAVSGDASLILVFYGGATLGSAEVAVLTARDGRLIERISGGPSGAFQPSGASDFVEEASLTSPDATRITYHFRDYTGYLRLLDEAIARLSPDPA